jgi:hypothetical protein
VAEPFQFSDANIAEIQRLLNLGRYPDAYRYVAGLAARGVGVDDKSITWLYGAAEINAGIGFNNEFIRGYTKEQYEIRYGSSAGVDAAIQNASNSIAISVLVEMIQTRKVPAIDIIAVRDAAPVATDLSSLVVTVKNVQSTAGFTASVSGSGLDSLFGIEEIVGSGKDDTFAIQSLPANFTDLKLDGGGGADQPCWRCFTQVMPSMRRTPLRTWPAKSHAFERRQTRPSF